MTQIGRHAIVIGASIGGLLAARALAEHFAQVTIVERDEVVQAFKPRKGVPQGRHTHTLLARGREVLEQLFPGLSEEAITLGAIRFDLTDEVLWFNHGVYLQNAPSELLGLAISRPKLEGVIRRRLLQLANIRLREGCDAREPAFDRVQKRVTGLRVRSRAGSGGAETMSADLVVDASGRGSQSPNWLDAMGYARAREESFKVDIGYMTMQYRRGADHLNGKNAVVMAGCEPDWRCGVILGQDDGRWIVTLGGYLGDHAPADQAGFIEFARSLQKPEIFDVIKDAELLSSPTSYQFTANLRRHYEELRRFPEGFLVFGDALCSFNPIYGQGMTVACAEALALRDCLASGVPGTARRFFQAASRLIDVPWQIAVGSDLRHPRVQGERTLQVRFVNWYITKLFQSAQRDAVLATKFVGVANLMHQPATLLDPRITLRVWKGSLAWGGASPA